MSEIKNKLGVLIAEKNERDDCNYTYKDITRETKISPTTLSSYIRNRVTRYDASTLMTLCDWLECDLSELLVYKPVEAPMPS